MNWIEFKEYMKDEWFLWFIMIPIFTFFLILIIFSGMESARELELTKDFCPNYVTESRAFASNEYFCPDTEGVLHKFLCNNQNCYYTEVKK